MMYTHKVVDFDDKSNNTDEGVYVGSFDDCEEFIDSCNDIHNYEVLRLNMEELNYYN